VPAPQVLYSVVRSASDLSCTRVSMRRRRELRRAASQGPRAVRVQQWWKVLTR